MKRKSVVWFAFVSAVFGVACRTPIDTESTAAKATGKNRESLPTSERREDSDTEASVSNEAIDLARYSPDEEGARQLLSEFLKDGANRIALTAALRPRPEDFRAVFVDEAVSKRAQDFYEKMWESSGAAEIAPKEGQTELLLISASTEDLKAGGGNATEFPGGYKKAAPLLSPKLVVYRWKFVQAGSTIGMAYDGLYNIGGRWIFIPKPWRIPVNEIDTDDLDTLSSDEPSPEKKKKPSVP